MTPSSNRSSRWLPRLATLLPTGRRPRRPPTPSEPGRRANGTLAYPVLRHGFELAIAAAFGVAAMLFVYHPMFTSRLDLMHKALGDGRLVNYILEHGYRWICGDPAHTSFWSPPVFYPHENVAAFTDVMVGAAPLYWIWRALGAAPDTAYQLFQLAVFAVNFLAIRWFLGRGLAIGNVAASGTAALVVTFHTIHFIKHPQLAAVFFVFLAATAVARTLDTSPNRPRPSARRAWIASGFASLAAQAWTGFYVFYFFGLFAGIAAIVAMFDREARSRMLSALRTDPLVIGISAAASAGLLGILGYRYGITVRECGTRGLDTVDLPTLGSWWLPIQGPLLYDSISDAFGLRGENPARAGQAFGFGMGAVVVAGFVWGLRTGRRRLLVPLGIATVALAALTTRFGDVSAWNTVREVLPGASAIRYVMRISMVAILPAAIAIAVVATECSRRRILAVVPMALFAILGTELFPSLPWIPKERVRAQTARVAASVDTKMDAFVVACTTPGYRFTGEDALWVQLATGIPTVSGRYGNFPPSLPKGIRHASSVARPRLVERLAVRRGVVTWAETNGLDPDRIQVVEYEADVIPRLRTRAREIRPAAASARPDRESARAAQTNDSQIVDRAASLAFTRSSLRNLDTCQPTSLQFGPDGRLYVADRRGKIQAHAIERTDSGVYRVVTTESIALVKNIPNHDDDGTPRPDVTQRQVTGLLVTGTADSPVIWVSSSDPRGPGEVPDAVNVDTNSGVVSRLFRATPDGPWQRHDVVRGLPRASNDHATNGLQLDEATRTLFVAQGGFTNMGAPSRNFGRLPEYALSAAILRIDLDAIGDATYDLPTLDDEDRPGARDPNDPFGGNRGKNQAILLEAGPVTVHASGFRNPYDLVLTESGEMYTIDNGPNSGWGGTPVHDPTRGGVTNDPSEPGRSFDDGLHRVTPGMYAGHPNPTRANPANTFNETNPQSPVHRARPEEAHYLEPGGRDGALLTFDYSTNGITEYRSDAFGGRMRGDLLAIGLDERLYRIRIGSDGERPQCTPLFHAVGKRSLDVTTQSDDEAFPGTIWIADLAGRTIHVFEPTTEPITNGRLTAKTIDRDGDGYSDEDEQRNGTSPDNAADVPPDFDDDGLSDLVDPDDDGDGVFDVDDRLALDPSDGRTTSVGFRRTFTESGDSPQSGSGLFGLGFTGLLSDGVHDYTELYDPAMITAGGAGGVFTLDRVGAGDALTDGSVQRQAFQLGVDLHRERRAVRIGARVAAPFAGLDAHDAATDAAIGIYIGTGDHDNVLRLAVTPRDGGSISCVSRVDGVTATDHRRRTNAFPIGDLLEAVPLADVDAVDLFLHVDPKRALVRPSYRVVRDGIVGEMRHLGEPRPFPRRWIRETSLVVGLMATSPSDATVLSASWHSIEVELDPTNAAASAASERDRASTTANYVPIDLPSTKKTGDLTWVRGEDAPVPRVESARIATGSHLLVFGGFVNDSLDATARVDAYDFANDRWTRRTDMPMPITHVTAATDGDTVWFAGGFEGHHPGRATTRVTRYDVAADTWSTGPPLPEPRGGGGAAIVDGRLHFFGGLAPDRRTDCADHWILDLDDPTAWKRGAPMPVPRNHSGITVFEGRIWVVGGQSGHDGGNTDLDVVHTYDPAADRWSVEAPLPAARSHNEGGTFVHDGRIFSLSGQKERGTISDEIFVYTPRTKSWSLFGRIPVKMNGTAAAPFGDRLFVATGSVKGGKAPISAVWITTLR